MTDLLLAKHILNLRHQDAKIRFEAIAFLGKQKDSAAVLALLRALDQSYRFSEFSDWQMASRIAQALGEIGDRMAVPNLVEALMAKNEEIRLHAVHALGQIGDAEAIPDLILALEKASGRVAVEVIHAMGRIGDAAAVPAFIGVWGKPGLRLPIVKALGEMDHPAAVFALVVALRDKDPIVRRAAADALVEIGTLALPGLLQTLKNTDRSVREEFLDALGEIGAPVVAELVEILKDENPIVRSRAAQALGKIGNREACPALIATLLDTSALVRWDAACALDSMEDAAGLSTLSAVFRDKDQRSEVFLAEHAKFFEDSTRRIMQLGHALSKAGIAVVPTLLDALGDVDNMVRCAAANGLRRLGSSETLPRKILAANHFAVQERIEILEKLRHVRRGDAWYQFPETSALCRTVLAESDPEAREGAQAVLGWMILLRGSQATSGRPSEELVRPAHDPDVSTDPTTMLRGAEQPVQRADPTPECLSLWQRLFRR